MKSPALGQPSAPMAQKSTPEWQIKPPALEQPSACVLGGSALRTPLWHRLGPLDAYSHASMVPEPNWSHPPTTSPSDVETWPTNLMDIICDIKTMPPRHPTQPEFTFDLTPEAVIKLSSPHEKVQWQPWSSLEAQRNLIVGYGLEFRDVNTLQKKSLAGTQTGRGCPKTWRTDRNGPSNPSMKS